MIQKALFSYQHPQQGEMILEHLYMDSQGVIHFHNITTQEEITFEAWEFALPPLKYQIKQIQIAI
jgi:hypothetical protein